MSAEPPARRDRSRTFELLWGTQEAPSRGPRPSLSVKRIVDTAIGLADAEGLPAVSMRRIADELGVTTMSLYRYIPSKDDLLELMMDGGFPSLPERGDLPGDWREALTRIAYELGRSLRHRPWLLQIPITGPPMGPTNVTVMDRVLDIMRDSGLTPDEVLGVLLLVTSYVRGDALIATGMEQAEESTGERWEDVEAEYGRTLAQLAATGNFPGIALLAQAETFNGPPPETDTGFGPDFQFSLDIIFDGVEALLARRARQRRDESTPRDETLAAGERSDARDAHETTTCPVCGSSVDQPGTGRPRVYCSRACQQRAYRKRKSG